jgi:saccharopine dehydrogenase (NAD+, L-lysine forming)
MVMNGTWKQPGVFNVEQLDPDPFMQLLGPMGLPWHEVIDGDFVME